ncbi:MAG: Glucose-phosphate adenylyltransferase, partial [Bacteroidota bacterium]
YNAHLAGIEEVLLLLHPTDAVTQEYCEQLMKNDTCWGLRIFFARQHIPEGREKPAGTADAVYQALSQQKSWQNGRLIVCNSDNLYSVKALNALWNSSESEALIAYNRDSLLYPAERISAFALIKTDKDGYLLDIIEKPTAEQAAELQKIQGTLGVSMNIFVFEASVFMPYLAKTPYHPVRNEKELPTAVFLYGEGQGRGFYTIPMAENVPDLTSKEDIMVMQKYLEDTYGKF